MIRDAPQQLLVEVLAKELEKNYSFALFVAERGTATKEVVYVLERQGFIRPHMADENDKRTIYMVDMHEPLMFLHNLDTTIKEPFASNPAVLDAVEKNHRKLQIAMTKLYPGNLVLSLSSGIMYIVLWIGSRRSTMFRESRWCREDSERTCAFRSVRSCVERLCRIR